MTPFMSVHAKTPPREQRAGYLPIDCVVDCGARERVKQMKDSTHKGAYKSAMCDRDARDDGSDPDRRL